MAGEEKAMIQLTEEQHRLLMQHGTEPARAIDPATNTEYVLLRAEVYERIKAILSADTVYTTAEMLDRTMAEDDTRDPHLEELQKKYGGAQA
jgi:hypothetical protein